jgi:hypothetical protein
MTKERVSFAASALFTALLFAGTFFVTCDKLPFKLQLLLGSCYGLWLGIYAIASGFALIDTIFRYFYLFADRGTVLQPRMSRGRAWILLGAILICALALRWSATLCR